MLVLTLCYSLVSLSFTIKDDPDPLQFHYYGDGNNLGNNPGPRKTPPAPVINGIYGYYNSSDGIVEIVTDDDLDSLDFTILDENSNVVQSSVISLYSSTGYIDVSALNSGTYYIVVSLDGYNVFTTINII